MNKRFLILQYFQKKDQLTVKKREYQQTISSLFKWLIENDKVGNDRTSKFFPNIKCTAEIISKDKGIIVGIEEIEFLLGKYTRLSLKPQITDGQKFKEKQTIAQISGKFHDILAYERTVLNILQRMSGIATETNRLIHLIQDTPSRSHFVTPGRWPDFVGRSQDFVGRRPNGLLPGGHNPFIAATRKTPWMSLDKKAVAVGGGLTHRLNLSDGILVKDNHLALAGKTLQTPRGWTNIIDKAIKTPQGWPAYKDSPGVEETGRLIEVEVENYHQAHQVIKTFQSAKDTSGVTRRGSPDGGGISNNTHLAILLDNFTPAHAKKLLSDLNNLYDLSDIIFEASGGIDKNNILEWAKTGVDILSLGSLTHSAHAANLSLEICSF